jgi:hypothetical protein
MLILPDKSVYILPDFGGHFFTLRIHYLFISRPTYSFTVHERLLAATNIPLPTH